MDTTESYDLERIAMLSPLDAVAMGRSIAERLTQQGGKEPFGRDLVRLLQYLQIPNQEVRSLLSEALFHVARGYRDRGLVSEEETLCAAVRMGAVLAEKPAGLAPLADFLTEASPEWVLRVALQSLYNEARTGPFPMVPVLRPLVSSVEHLLNLYCKAELLIFPSVTAVAGAAVAAARALSMPIEDRLAVFRRSPQDEQRVRVLLDGLTMDWSPADQALLSPTFLLNQRNARAVKAWLELPAHRQLDLLEGDACTLEWICTELRELEKSLDTTLATLARLRADYLAREKGDSRPAEDDGPNEPAPGRGTRLSRRDFVKAEPPRYPQLQLGQEFINPSTGHRWRVTDLGTRTFLAVDVTSAASLYPSDPSWLNGPPYAVPEVTWDEYDFPVLAALPNIDWSPLGARRALDDLLQAVKVVTVDWKGQDGTQSELLDALTTAYEAYAGTLPGGS